MTKSNRIGHIRLTSHPGRAGVATRFPIHWGAASARERGPVVGTVNAGIDRNAIGAHGGSYALYRALAERYAEALKLLGHESVLAPEDCVAAGHWRIARAAGLC